MQVISRSREASMESPSKGSTGRGRKGISGGRRTHRSASNLSSTSSDILVAPGPSSVSRQASHSIPASPTAPAVMAPPQQRITARVKNKRFLIITFPPGDKGEILQKYAERSVKKRAEEGTANLLSDEKPDLKVESTFVDDDGPNHRGTYSKKYVEQHPEIQWVHRGQGRYKPASDAKTPTSNISEHQLKTTDPGLLKTIDMWRTTTRRSNIPQRRRSWNANERAAEDSVLKERPSLRRLTSEAQTSSTPEQRAARLARRAKVIPTTEIERRSSRRSSHQIFRYADEDSSTDDMAGDKEPTYTTDYVQDHPDEKFYHTGNGWWKRGERPKARKHAKERESEGHALMRQRDGSFQFNRGKTIHVSQLDNYPGVEFHHCGNGWYKAGNDPTGHRASRIVGETELEDEDEYEREQSEDGEDESAAVSKEYTLDHPEIEWVHRGNGRYKRKSIIGASTATASATPSAEPGHDKTIYSKDYVLQHPDEEFHHRGNARYMRGPPPEHWASVRRRKSAAANAATTAAPPSEPDDDSVLFSKDYVKANPHLVFHHRGQGRYARGPRPKTLTMSNDDEQSDVDLDGLVDTDYVDAHPDETFHHRGQGRWARGLPPAGASNKVAIRGPGAKEKTDAARLLDDEDEANKPPSITALVLKVDGPDMWPGLQWHYRGGGKWGRITKQEYEDMQRGGSSRRPKGKGRMTNMDGPEAQLEREAAAAEAARRCRDGAGAGGNGLQDRPKVKRRRTNKRGSFQAQEEGLMSKQSSNSQSQAPTPKPRMLEPDEDILAEEDLPQLFRDEWSPASEDFEDEAQGILHTKYRPINPPEKFVKALTKHNPQVRSLENLKILATNASSALKQLQDEYLELDKITAPHARIPRKSAKGGRVPIDPLEFEDRKEATLYDYAFDARRLGFQDPQTQRIQRDPEGRELRNRRNRSGVPAHGTLPGWNFGDDEPLGPRRPVKQPSRFDGIIDQPRKRTRTSNLATGHTSKAPSMTPDRVTTPLGGPAPNRYAPATSGRWRGHVPKRIRELRDESVGGGSVKRDASPGSARKGRPPGSKNLHKRKDAGIKKGPRKPKAVDGSDTPFGSEAEGEA